MCNSKFNPSYMSPLRHPLKQQGVTAETIANTGIQRFRHPCHTLYSKSEGKVDTCISPIPEHAGLPVPPLQGVTGMTDSCKRRPSAGFGRHTLVFQGVTASPLGVTECHFLNLKLNF